MKKDDISATEVTTKSLLMHNNHKNFDFQEELCENIAQLIQCFGKLSTSILFYKCFLKTMGQNWFGIDQHRLDKFLMVVEVLK